MAGSDAKQARHQIISPMLDPRVIRLCVSLLLLTLAGCQTTRDMDAISSARGAALREIQNEQAGDYYIGRRFYKKDYKFWGYVRRPGEPWKNAQLVMLNEQRRLAPDR